MYKDQKTVWNEYLETGRHTSSAVKLNRILKRRIKVFIKARQTRLYEESIS